MFNMIYTWTNKVKNKVAKLAAKLDEKGQGIVEYAMILAAVAIIALFVLYNNGNESLDGAVTNAYSDASTKINNVTDQDIIQGNLDQGSHEQAE